MESAASGILAGINAVRFAENKDFLDLPQTTMLGALSEYISDKKLSAYGGEFRNSSPDRA